MNSQELSIPPILDAGIDYLRLTVKPGQGLSRFLNVWDEMIDESHEKGHEVKPFRFKGYTGVTCDGFKRLGREDSILFEAEGAQGNVAFARIKGFEFHGNIPRIDSHVTAGRTPDYIPQACAIFDEIRARESREATGRQRNLDVKRTRHGADTVYVGSRNSGNYLCAYDAGARHSDRYPKGAFRFECRHSDDVAREIYTRFQNAASVTCCATSIVMGKLIQLNLPQPWFNSDPPIMPISGFRRSTDEQSLAWIAGYVSGTIQRLIRAGYAEDLCEILGVQSLVLSETIAPDEPYRTPRKRLTGKGLR